MSSEILLGNPSRNRFSLRAPFGTQTHATLPSASRVVPVSGDLEEDERVHERRLT